MAVLSQLKAQYDRTRISHFPPPLNSRKPLGLGIPGITCDSYSFVPISLDHLPLPYLDGRLIQQMKVPPWTLFPFGVCVRQSSRPTRFPHQTSSQSRLFLATLLRYREVLILFRSSDPDRPKRSSATPETFLHPPEVRLSFPDKGVSSCAWYSMRPLDIFEPQHYPPRILPPLCFISFLVEKLAPPPPQKLSSKNSPALSESSVRRGAVALEWPQSFRPLGNTFPPYAGPGRSCERPITSHPCTLVEVIYLCCSPTFKAGTLIWSRLSQKSFLGVDARRCCLAPFVFVDTFFMVYQNILLTASLDASPNGPTFPSLPLLDTFPHGSSQQSPESPFPSPPVRNFP